MAEPARKQDFDIDPKDVKLEVDLRVIPGGGQSTPRKKGHLRSAKNNERGSGPQATSEDSGGEALDSSAQQAQGGSVAPPSQGNPNYDPEDKRGMYEDAVAPGKEYGKVSPGEHGGAPNPAQLKERENNGEGGGGAATDNKNTPKGAQEETTKIADKLGKGWTGGDEADSKSEQKGLRSRLNRKKLAATGFVVSAIISLLTGAFSLLHGPFEFLHFSSFLEKHFISADNSTDGRVGKLLKYARTRNDPNRRNLGWKGNAMADYYERKMAKAGIIVDYALPDGTRSGSIQRFKIDSKTEQGKDALKKFENIEFDQSRVTKNADGIVTIDVNIRGTDGTKATRTILKSSINAMGFNKVSNQISNRVLRFRAGVSYHQLKKRSVDKGEDLIDFVRRVEEDRDKTVADGVEETDLNGQSNGEDPADQNNPDQTDAADKADNVANEINEITDVDPDAIPGEAGVAATAGKLKASVTKGLGAVAIVSFVCSIKTFGDQFGPFMKANIIEPMMRMGIMYMSIASQVKAPAEENKDVRAAELGVYGKAFFDEASKMDWSAAATMQNAMGKDPTGPDLPSSLKPTRSKPAFFAYIDKIPGIGPTCDAIGSTLGTVALTVVGAFAGGPVSVATDYITDLVIGKVADSLHIFENLARLIFKGGVSTDAAGPLLGNIANYGARLASNDAEIAKGGRELTGTEVAELEADNRRIFLAEQSQKNFYARYLDPKDINSVVGSAMVSMPRDPVGAIAAFVKAPIQSIGNIFRPAGAQSTVAPYDYGFPLYGFSIQDQDDPRFEDPYANADIVEPRLAQLNQEYGECFSTTIDPNTGNIQTKDTKLYPEIPDKCKSDNEDLKRYSFYLLDTFTSNSMLCYAGDDASCNNVRGTNSPTGNQGAGVPGSGSNPGGLIIGDPYTDSTSVPCAQGTNFIRVDTAYVNGNPYPINLCGLPNILDHGVPTEVNSRVSGAWFKLVNDAAAQGISFFANSGYRTMAEQEALYYGSSNPGTAVATPGYSSHQAGVAIDFGNMSNSNFSAQSCDVRVTIDTPEYNWMYANASKYGFKQYSAEAWHWDAYPASNRC